MRFGARNIVREAKAAEPPKLRLSMVSEAKKLRKSKKELKLKKDPGHGEIWRLQCCLQSEGTGTPKIACNFENRGEYLYRPLLFWDQEIRKKNCTLLDIVEGICIAPSFWGPKIEIVDGKRSQNLSHFFTKCEK